MKILRQSHDPNSPVLQEALHSYKLKKNLYRKSIRWNKVQDSVKRDSELFNTPAGTFANIRKRKRCNQKGMNKLEDTMKEECNENK